MDHLFDEFSKSLAESMPRAVTAGWGRLRRRVLSPLGVNRLGRPPDP